MPSLDATLPGPRLPPAYFVTELDARFEARTDAGRRIPLFYFQAYVFPIEGEQLPFRPGHEGDIFLRLAEEKFLANTKQDVSRLIRVAEPSPQCNCHGWIFAEGKFLVQDAHVLTILADNGYSLVREPQAGDVVIFRRGDIAAHSGFVRLVRGGAGVLIESKWGPFGVFKHALDAHPFRGECCFYRSARRGHALEIVRESG